jgi:Na+-driven multidrug efflux pump
MTPKRTTRAIIIVSLVFAIAMVASSMMIAEKDASQTVNLILIALWFIPFSYLAGTQTRKSDKR